MNPAEALARMSQGLPVGEQAQEEPPAVPIAPPRDVPELTDVLRQNGFYMLGQLFWENPDTTYLVLPKRRGIALTAGAFRITPWEPVKNIAYDQIPTPNYQGISTIRTGALFDDKRHIVVVAGTVQYEDPTHIVDTIDSWLHYAQAEFRNADMNSEAVRPSFAYHLIGQARKKR
jgi:hypothetical protein